MAGQGLMDTPLSRSLIPKLRARFPAVAMRVEPDAQSLVVFPPQHPAVGDVAIQDDGDELTLYLGGFSHIHFSNDDDTLCAEEKAEDIAHQVVQFLAKLFADQIEFYGSAAFAGGCRERGTTKRSAVSKFLLGRSWVWSGPLDD
jgi:hypothetical protein